MRTFFFFFFFRSHLQFSLSFRWTFLIFANFPNLASTFLIWPEKRLGSRIPLFCNYACWVNCYLYSILWGTDKTSLVLPDNYKATLFPVYLEGFGRLFKKRKKMTTLSQSKFSDFNRFPEAAFSSSFPGGLFSSFPESVGFFWPNLICTQVGECSN